MQHDQASGGHSLHLGQPLRQLIKQLFIASLLGVSLIIPGLWLPDSSIIFIFIFIFSYYIQHCFVCRPSDSTVPTDAGIEPRARIFKRVWGPGIDSKE